MNDHQRRFIKRRFAKTEPEGISGVSFPVTLPGVRLHGYTGGELEKADFTKTQVLQFLIEQEVGKDTTEGYKRAAILQKELKRILDE